MRENDDNGDDDNRDASDALHILLYIIYIYMSGLMITNSNAWQWSKFELRLEIVSRCKWKNRLDKRCNQ